MNLDSLNEEESELADNMRQICTPYGDERLSKIEESTRLLYRLGCVYVKKAALAAAMEQKLNFIKASALLHGARVRSNKFLKGYYATKIHSALSDMETQLLKNCFAVQHVPLYEISCDILRTFEIARIEEKKSLDSLEKIGSDDADAKIQIKISCVQDLLRSNTRHYKKQMAKISEECLRILGRPPCGFAIAGLGSLARNEVTLYSDFEHVIILEEEVAETCYGKVLEYFRWFSVLFHVIIIGMGETVIRSIGIKSLSDLYSSDKSKNWFYDSFTTSGIAFDGMVPYSCKIPIGRQEGTAKKPHTVELIKPVSEMASYLTKEEDMRNGYCLKDVLCETCFVFGSEEIYSEFKQKAGKILAQEQSVVTLASMSRCVKKNYNPYVAARETLPDARVAVDVKTALYRPLSVFVGHLSRFQGTGGASGFDKIVQLNDIPISHDKKRLLWAFAVSCEVRLKAYSHDYGNRIKSFGREVLDYVEKSCFVNCAAVVVDSANYLSSPSHYHEYHEYLNKTSSSLLFIMEYSDAREILLRQIIENKERDPDIDNMAYEWQLATIYLHEAELRRAKVTLEEQATDFSTCPELLEKAENLFCPKSVVEPRVCHLLTRVYLEQQRFAEAMVISSRIFETQESITNDEMMMYREVHLRAANSCMSDLEYLNHCKKILSQNRDIGTQLQCGLALADAHRTVGESHKAQELLTDLLKLCAAEGPGNVSLMNLVLWMQRVFLYQFREKWYSDCVDTLYQYEDLTETRREHFFKQGPVFHDIHAYEVCLLGSRGKSTAEKIKLNEKAIEICKRMQNVQDYELQYFMAVNLLTERCIDNNFEVYDIARLHEVFQSAPRSIRTHPAVVAHTNYSMLQYHGILISDQSAPILEILHKAIFSYHILNCLHPLLYPGLHILLSELPRQLVQTLSESHNPIVHQLLHIFGCLRDEIDCKYLNDIQQIVNSNWKLLFKLKTVPKATLSDFVHLICVFTCMSQLRYLGLCLEVSQNIYCRSVGSRFQLEFRNAVVGYGSLDFKCAKVFWKFFCKASKGSQVQRLSATFLCGILQHVFVIEFGYNFYLDHISWKIYVGSCESHQEVRAKEVKRGAFMTDRRNELREDAMIKNAGRDLSYYL